MDEVSTSEEPLITKEQIKTLMIHYIKQQGLAFDSLAEEEGYIVGRIVAHNGRIVGSVHISPAIESLTVSQAMVAVQSKVMDSCRALVREPAFKAPPEGKK